MNGRAEPDASVGEHVGSGAADLPGREARSWQHPVVLDTAGDGVARRHGPSDHVLCEEERLLHLQWRKDLLGHELLVATARDHLDDAPGEGEARVVVVEQRPRLQHADGRPQSVRA